MLHAREQSCQGRWLMSLWLSTLWYNGSQLPRSGLRSLQKEDWISLRSPAFNFLAVELFSTNVELPHISSHFLQSPAHEAAAAGQLQVCRPELLRAWLGVCRTSANEKLSTSGLQVTSGWVGNLSRMCGASITAVGAWQIYLCFCRGNST